MKRKNTPAARAFRKVKARSVGKLKKDLHALLSRWIRARDNYVCFTCDKAYPPPQPGAVLHAGHFISRARGATTFDPDNLNAQCYFCNVRERGNIGEYTPRLMQKLGPKKFKALLDRGRQLKQWSAGELATLISTLKEHPEDYESTYRKLTNT
jgi:Bacteriophage Lambda NinG protein